jgi:AsmA protein
MTSTRPPGRGSPQHPRRDSLGDQRYGANLPHGFAGERRPQQPPPRTSLARAILLYGGVALLCLGVGAATFFIMSPPTDYIQREIIAGVKRETGRDLKIGGGASFTLFPSLGLRLNDVSLSAPPGMGGEPLVKMTSFNVGVRLMPLLRQEVVVDRLELNDPVFSLRVDAEGRRSWDAAGVELPVRFAGASGRSGGLSSLLITPAAAAPRELGAVSLNDIRITNGALRYNDERNGAWGRFDGLNAEFSLPAMDRPLTGNGSLVSEGETFEFKSTLTSPADLAEQRAAKLALTVSGVPLTFSYEGTVSPNDGSGTLTASSPSLAALAHWWGNDVSPEAGAGEVAFTARLHATQTSVQLSDIDLKAGKTAASGTVGFEERQGARPHVTADLKVSGLNVAELPLGADLRVGRGASPAVPAPSPLSLDAPAEAPQPAEPDSIEDLLNRPGPQVKGYTERAGGWSTEPINIKALGLADVDARLALTDFAYGRTRIDGAQVTLGVKDQVAKVTLADLRLYDGSGHGLVTLDASSNEPSFTSDVSLTGISAGPLLRDSAKVDWLAGTADVAWKVSGHGATEAAIVASLDGTSRVAVRDGAVIGFDLGGALQGLSEGSIPNFAHDPAKKTDFRSLTGTFTIANGIATNNDLKLDSQHLHAAGDGAVDLPQRSLDYTVRPKLVANLGGDGGEANAVGIEVPVRITGSWEQPQFAPDIEGAINNPNTVDAVKQIGKQLKGKNAGEIVQDLFGKGEDGSPSKAEKLLDSLFGDKE